MVKKKKKMHNEECWVLVGRFFPGRWWCGFRTRYTVGDPGSVRFNPQWVLKRHDDIGDIMGFDHTHPNTLGSPSSTDYATMRAWVGPFGLHLPLVCIIRGTDGVRAHWFLDEDSEPIETKVRAFGPFLMGIAPEFTEEEDDVETEESPSECCSC